jgi:hypothetical protein
LFNAKQGDQIGVDLGRKKLIWSHNFWEKLFCQIWYPCQLARMPFNNFLKNWLDCSFNRKQGDQIGVNLGIKKIFCHCFAK